VESIRSFGAVRAPSREKRLLKPSRCLAEVLAEETVAPEEEAEEAREVPEGAEVIEPVVRRPLVTRRACALPSVGMSSTMEIKQPPISSR